MINHPKIWLGIVAATIVVASLITVALRPAFGIDFTGGSLIEIKTAAAPADIRTPLKEKLNLETQVQTTDSGSLIIRTSPLDPAAHDALLQTLRDANVLEEELRFESIGPTIGAELRRKAWIAVAITVVVMIVYLAYSFRQTAGLISSWKFGVAAAIALVHDLLVVTALFTLLKPFGATIDTLFVTAILAILGYSINDTIVLFNRLQTEWLRTRASTLIEVIDRATKATVVRSLNTSITTLLVLLALLLFGGETIRWFIVALAAGTVAGTYSSLFVAPPILWALAKRKK